MFGLVLTVPDEETFWLTVRTATVVEVRTIAVIVRAITTSFEALIDFIIFLAFASFLSSKT